MKIIDLNTMRQTYTFDCGAKALQSVLAFYGVDVREEDLLKKLKTTEDGTKVRKVISVAESYGFEVKHGKITLDILKKIIKLGVPVIVLLQAWSETKKSLEEWKDDWEDGHYVVVIGAENGKIVFEDPSSVKRTWLTDEEFIARWHDIDSDSDEKFVNYAIVVYGKKPETDSYEHMD